MIISPAGIRLAFESYPVASLSNGRIRKETYAQLPGQTFRDGRKGPSQYILQALEFRANNSGGRLPVPGTATARARGPLPQSGLRCQRQTPLPLWEEEEDRRPLSSHQKAKQTVLLARLQAGSNDSFPAGESELGRNALASPTESGPQF